MKQILLFLKNYYRNIKLILKSYNNPLKKIENVLEKDLMEKDFYNNLAEKYLKHFDESLFRYDKNEEFPLSHQYFYSRLENISNKKILDCCCGYGFTTVKCAKHGDFVWGIDISPKMIQLAQKNVNFNHVSNRVDLKIMSVQKMDFDDHTFDYVVGLGALHHLNLELAGKEISRVLKPHGVAVFLEPRIPFRWLVYLRSLFPTKCFESPGGGQLCDKEIKEFSQNFDSYHVHYFIFLRKLARLPIINKLSKQLDQIDSMLIKIFPFLKIFYFTFVLEFYKSSQSNNIYIESNQKKRAIHC